MGVIQHLILGLLPFQGFCLTWRSGTRRIDSYPNPYYHSGSLGLSIVSNVSYHSGDAAA
jgi:hypothetical protein